MPDYVKQWTEQALKELREEDKFYGCWKHWRTGSGVFSVEIKRDGEPAVEIGFDPQSKDGGTDEAHVEEIKRLIKERIK